jgi:hypothetical protein
MQGVERVACGRCKPGTEEVGERSAYGYAISAKALICVTANLA